MTNFSAYCRVNTQIVQRIYCGSSFIVFRLKQRKEEFSFVISIHSWFIHVCVQTHEIGKKSYLHILGWVSHYCNCEGVNLRCGSVSGLQSSIKSVTNVTNQWCKWCIFCPLIPESALQSQSLYHKMNSLLKLNNNNNKLLTRRKRFLVSRVIFVSHQCDKQQHRSEM